MKLWNFKIFVSGNGRKDFEDWVDSLHEKDQTKIDWLIEYLKITKIWGMPYFKKITGHNELFELRVYGQNKVPLRPLGGFGPKSNEFTIVLGAIEDDGSYKPKDALKTAAKRVKLIHKKGYTDDY